MTLEADLAQSGWTAQLRDAGWDSQACHSPCVAVHRHRSGSLMTVGLVMILWSAVKRCDWCLCRLSTLKRPFPCQVATVWVAEGLLMYLEESEVASLLKEASGARNQLLALLRSLACRGPLVSSHSVASCEPAAMCGDCPHSGSAACAGQTRTLWLNMSTLAERSACGVCR